MRLSELSSPEQIKVNTSEETLETGHQEPEEGTSKSCQEAEILLCFDVCESHEIINLPFPSIACEITLPCEMKGTH